jgi:enoyl-CoA hydratase/isomerase-like protein
VTEEIEIAVADGVQVIRFLRPEKKNAFTGPMYAAMSQALEAAENNDTIAAHVFIGSGGIFSAGNDINDFLRRAQAATQAPAGDRQGIPTPSLDFIRHLPKVTKPMIAAVDGLAIGVGATMLLHCDLVYATPEASLRTPFLDPLSRKPAPASPHRRGSAIRAPSSSSVWANRSAPSGPSRQGSSTPSSRLTGWRPRRSPRPAVSPPSRGRRSCCRAACCAKASPTSAP